MKRRIYTVEGRGAFPVDMLRYDDSWPANPVDAEAVTHPLEHLMQYRVTLETHSAHAPTIGRWRSFGWRVVDINGTPVYEASNVARGARKA